MSLGTRGRRHEGHGRDGPGLRSRPGAHGGQAGPHDDVRVLRRRGGRGYYGSQWVVDHHPDWFDGRHRGDQRGRRLQRHGALTGIPAPRRARTCCRPRRRACSGCACTHGAGLATARCRPTPTPCSGWPRRSPGSPSTSGRASTSPPCACSSTGCRTSPVPRMPTTTRANCSAHLGGARGFVLGTLSDTANPTMLSAGYKHNVVPQSATAALDCRFLPGHEESMMSTIARAGRRVRRHRGGPSRYRAGGARVGLARRRHGCGVAC